MAVPTNILQQVQTYQMSNLAYLQNLACFVSTANTRFKYFDRLTANLGDTVTFDLPPRFTTTNSLVASFQPADQRVLSLTVNQQVSTSYAFTDQQFIFNVREYMDKFGKAAVAELASQIEAGIALNCVTRTYRFYGDGVTPINSYNQLAKALALFRNYGSANGRAKGYIADVAVPDIVGSGLNQFALDRNEEAASSWELGMFSNCDWYQSNLLPVHYAGTNGDNGRTLTVVATTVDANGAVIGLTFDNGTGLSETNAFRANDKLQFQDAVSGITNLRYLTFIGHKVSNSPVQVRVTADADSVIGLSNVLIDPPLQVAPTAFQNINTPIVTGMKAKALPSHRAGMITSGDPLFLGMPQLPTLTPFPTGNMIDPDTGVSIRQYYGSIFGQNTRGMVHDCIYGSTLASEYSIALIFPL